MSRKSDKEVVIVHNREMIGGLTTHIDLSTINIDLHSLGEQRVLSWQQFEELASKYRSFFEQEIILLGPGQSDIAARYNLPVINRGNNHIVSHDEVENIYKLNARELEDFINTLTDKDKDFIFSYWLGKSYERVEGFYDRYKIELLNRLSGKHVFDNILVLMNGDFLNDTDGSVEIKANSKNTFNK